MNKIKAMQLARKGVKVTQRNLNELWLTEVNGTILFDSGVTYPACDFWYSVIVDKWNDGWSIFEEEISELNPKKKGIDEVIEDMQEAIVKAGGTFLRRVEIERMPVEEMLKILEANGVRLSVSNKNEK
jgi:hypothetical protein